MFRLSANCVFFIRVEIHNVKSAVKMNGINTPPQAANI